MSPDLKPQLRLPRRLRLIEPPEFYILGEFPVRFCSDFKNSCFKRIQSSNVGVGLSRDWGAGAKEGGGGAQTGHWHGAGGTGAQDAIATVKSSVAGL